MFHVKHHFNVSRETYNISLSQEKNKANSNGGLDIRAVYSTRAYPGAPVFSSCGDTYR